MPERSQRAIRFLKARTETLDDGRSRAVVEIEWAGTGNFTGAAEGGSAASDTLRNLARAAADAVTEATKSKGMSVRIRSVQQLEVQGSAAVVVSLAASREGKTKTLLGVCHVDGDDSRAVALAVLNATNRFLGVG
jgi:hypothetical protein